MTTPPIETLFAAKQSPENLLQVQARITGHSPDEQDPFIPTFQLSDYTGDIRCRVPSKALFNKYWVHDLVLVLLKMDRASGQTPEILCAKPIKRQRQSVSLIPRAEAARPSDLVLLNDLVAHVQHPMIKYLINQVLGNREIYKLYILAPASLNHHHNEHGGLLKHSIEVAQTMRMQFAGDQLSQDIGVAAALFHDIGKIKTLAPGMRTETGHLVDHQALNLEVLSPWLKTLDLHDPKLANQLRHLLCTKHPKSHYPESLIGKALKCADQMSVAKDRERLAFSGKPDWQKHCRLNEKEAWVRH